MALVLGLKQGQGFFLEKEYFSVEAVGDDSYTVYDTTKDQSIKVGEGEVVTIRDKVFLSMAEKQMVGVARVEIKAPQWIPIARANSEDDTPRNFVTKDVLDRFTEEHMPTAKRAEVIDRLTTLCKEATLSEAEPGWRENGDFFFKISGGRLVEFDVVAPEETIPSE